MNTGSIFITGVRSALFMAHPPIAFGGGGRTSFGAENPEEVLALLRRYGISGRLTFSNSLLQKKHLSDTKCNALCALFAENKGVQMVLSFIQICC